MNKEFEPYSLKDIEDLDKGNFLEYVEDFLYYESPENVKRLVRLLASSTVDNAKNVFRIARMLDSKEALAASVMALESYNTMNKCIFEIVSEGNEYPYQYDNECGHGDTRREDIAQMAAYVAYCEAEAKKETEKQK